MTAHWVWDRYWHCDRIASCFDGAGARNYDDCVGAGWRDFFSGLPDASRIIDLCTGNGAVALIAAQCGIAQGKSFHIRGVDQADIDPPSYVSRFPEEMAAVQFVPRTPVETLPFDDQSFDVAVSQYGIEYADTERAVPEIGRVLARGGKARFVVHAADGVVASNSRGVIAEADLLLEKFNLIGASRDCFEAVARVEKGDSSDVARQKAVTAVAAFKRALQLTSAHVPHAVDKMMFNNSGGVMLDALKARGQVGFDQVFAKVDCVEAEILAHRGRSQALVDAALDREGIRWLGGQLRDAGAREVSSFPLENDDSLIGYVVEARFA